MMNELSPLKDLLQEYQATSDANNVTDIRSSIEKLKKSLLTGLESWYTSFHLTTSDIAGLRKQFARIEHNIKSLKTNYKDNLIPLMNSSALASNRSLPNQLQYSETSTSALQQEALNNLREVLELQSMCQYLFDVHTIIDRLEESLSRLFKRGKIKITQPMNEKELQEEDKFDYGNLNEGSFGDNELEEELIPLASTLLEADEILSKKTVFEKSSIIVIQGFKRTFARQKAELREFVNARWEKLVRFSNSQSNIQQEVNKLELFGTKSELQFLLKLSAGLGDVKCRVDKLCLEIWNKFFLPWFESHQPEKNQSQNYFHLRSTESNVFSDLISSDSVRWRLQLVKKEQPAESSTVDAQSVVNTCNQLSSALDTMGVHLFSLHTDCLGNRKRIVDHCKELGIFHDKLSFGLLNGVLLHQLPPVIRKNELCSVLYSDTEQWQQFCDKVLIAIQSFITTASEHGYLNRQSDAVEKLNSYLNKLPTFTSQLQQYSYFESVVNVFKGVDNFFSVNLINEGIKNDAIAESNLDTILREEQLDKAELTKLFETVNMDFPSCYVSKAVRHLLKQVDEMISNVDSIITAMLAHRQQTEQTSVNCEDGNENATESETALQTVQSILYRVPHLIFMYLHIVPTLHANRLSTDLKFTAIYHNDCMYLAHECLTLGKLKLSPLAERVNSFLKPSVTTTHQSSFSQLASISTLQLVTQLRHAGTTVLLNTLTQQCELMKTNFNLSHDLREVSGEGAEKCQKAILACISQLIRFSKDVDILPLSIYLRCLGILSDELVKLASEAVVNLNDITTLDCTALIELFVSITTSITALFTPHCETASKVGNQESATPLEKSIDFLLNRRISTWKRFSSVLRLLQATSLEEIRSLWFNPVSDIQKLALQKTEVKRIICALYRESATRRNLLKQIEE